MSTQSSARHHATTSTPPVNRASRCLSCVDCPKHPSRGLRTGIAPVRYSALCIAYAAVYDGATEGDWIAWICARSARASGFCISRTDQYLGDAQTQRSPGDHRYFQAHFVLPRGEIGRPNCRGVIPRQIDDNAPANSGTVTAIRMGGKGMRSSHTRSRRGPMRFRTTRRSLSKLSPPRRRATYEQSRNWYRVRRAR
jgi:hypothetical protein